MERIRLVCVLVVGLLSGFFSVSQAAVVDRYVAWRSEGTSAHFIAQILMERSLGMKLPADSIRYEEVHMAEYASLPWIFARVESEALCKSIDCSPRIFRLMGDSFVDVLDQVDGLRDLPEKDFRIRAESNYGVSQLFAGGRILAWNHFRFVPLENLPKTPLLGLPFVDACQGLRTIRRLAEVGNPPEAGEQVCTCIVSRFAEIGLLPRHLDLFARYWEDPPPGSVRDGLEPDYSDALMTGSSALRACVFEAGYRRADDNSFEPPLLSLEPNVYTTDVAHKAFIEQCARADTVLNSRRIRTPDRALQVCGCLTDRLAVGFQVEPDRFDLLRRLFADEIDESEVDEASPSLLGDLDDATDQCMEDIDLHDRYVH